MLNQEQVDYLQPNFKVLQTIFLVLLVVPLLVFVVLFVMRGGKINTTFGVMTAMGIVIAVPEIIASFIVPSHILKNNFVPKAKAEDVSTTLGIPASLSEGLKVSSIVRWALLESAVFANLMFWNQEGSVYSLIAAGVSWLLLLSTIPTQAGFLNKMESLLENLSGKF